MLNRLKYYCIVNLKILSLLSSILAIDAVRGNEFQARIVMDIESKGTMDDIKIIDTKSINHLTDLPKLQSSIFYPISEFGYASPVANAPFGSIAIISFDDVITCDDWYSAGMHTKANLLMQCYNNPNIIGIIEAYNTPGGEASAIEIISEMHALRNKPVVGYVRQMCASAGYGIASSTDEIFAKSKMCEIGSIGTLMTYYDWPAYLISRGIPNYYLYAPDSDQKNLAYREAGKDPRNFGPYLEYLTVWNNYFKELVTASRGNKISATDPVWNGQLYFAEEAETHHLIDGIKNLQQVAMRVEELYNLNYKSQSITYV